MNMQEISKLTHEELNRAMIWCFYEGKMNYVAGMEWINAYDMSDCEPINYLNDYNLLMPLSIKYGLSLELPDPILGNIGTISKYIEGDTDIQVDYEPPKTTQRAICECLLAIKLESE